MQKKRKQSVNKQDQIDMERGRENQQSSFEDISSQQEEEQSQIKQRQAFYIPQPEEMADDQQLQDQQIEAFQYLLGVRKEAGNIKQENKKKKQIYREAHKQSRMGRAKNKNEQKKLSKRGQNQTHIQRELQKNKMCNLKWLTLWQEQLISNWLCVVKNIKYLSTHQQIQDHHKNFTIQRESSLQILSRKPKINHLISLPLDIIQQLISNLSEEYFSIITNSTQNICKNGKLYYYLWMYSLLALHKARAQYSIFQELASVNACILAQIENKKQKNVEIRGIEQFLVVSCILNKQFCQFNLSDILRETAMTIESIY